MLQIGFVLGAVYTGTHKKHNFCECESLVKFKIKSEAFAMTPLSASQLSFHQVFQSSLKCRQFNKKNVGARKSKQWKAHITKFHLTHAANHQYYFGCVVCKHENVLWATSKIFCCHCVVAIFSAHFIISTNQSFIDTFV